MSGSAAVGPKRPAMFKLQEGSTQHRTFQIVSWAIFGLIVVILPYLLANFRVSQFAQAMAFGVTILGINLAIGYSGLLSLGHIAFMGVGAYTTMILVNDAGFDTWMTFPVAFAICFVVGALVGLPALKIRGLYLALVTFSLAFTFPIILKIDGGGISRRTGGDNGRNLVERLVPPDWAASLLRIQNRNPQERNAIYLYFVSLVILLIMFGLFRNMLKSRAGRGILAIRDNHIGAAVSGIHLSQHKVITFGISAALAGIGGSMLAIALNSVGPSSFEANYAILTLVGLVLGGVFSLHGSWIGGLMVVFVQDLASRVTFTAIPFFQIERGSPLTRAVFGLVLILVAFFAPGGINSLGRKLKALFVQVIPKPPEPPKGAAQAAERPAAVSAPEETLTGASR